MMVQPINTVSSAGTQLEINRIRANELGQFGTLTDPFAEDTFDQGVFFDALSLDFLLQPLDTAAFFNLNLVIVEMIGQGLFGLGADTTNELDRLIQSELVISGTLFNRGGLPAVDIFA